MNQVILYVGYADGTTSWFVNGQGASVNELAAQANFKRTGESRYKV